MSSRVKRVGVDCSGADGEEMVASHDPGDVEGPTSGSGERTGYWHSRPMRVQLEHSGNVSWHLTFRRLQLRQPRRDLVCPFLGMGLRRLTVNSVPDADGVAVADADPESPESDEWVGGSESSASMMRPWKCSWNSSSASEARLWDQVATCDMRHATCR
jgi:hypothetical protein